MSSPHKLQSTAQVRSWFVPFSFSSSWFAWTFLTAYYKTKVKSNGKKAPSILTTEQIQQNLLRLAAASGS